jgi:hypothetical protein
MHLIEQAELRAACFALLQMLLKIEPFDFVGFSVKISHQVFGAMTNWSFN